MAKPAEADAEHYTAEEIMDGLAVALQARDQSAAVDLLRLLTSVDPDSAHE